MEHLEFKRVLVVVWEKKYEGTNMFQLWFKIKELKHTLKCLNSYMASYEHKPMNLRQDLEVVQSWIANNPMKKTLIEQENKIVVDIQKWSKVE